MIVDYSRCTLNMMASILKNFGGKGIHPSLEELDSLSGEPYNHVILMVFDGLGQSFVEKYERELNLPAGTGNIPLSTVFPPTTAAAMTSLYTGDSPREHGYLGWNMWFDELEDKYINVLPGTENPSNKAYYGSPRDIYDILPLDSFMAKLRRADPDLPLYFISPRAFRESRYNGAACGPAKSVHYKKFKDMIRAAASSVRKNKQGRSYTMVYHMEPDKFIHPEGVETNHLRDFMGNLGEQLRKLIRRIEGTNTLLLVTADHGMIGMENYYIMKKGEELYSLLKRPPFPEARTLFFHVKEGEKERFRERFIELLGKDFLLMEAADFLSGGWLGPEIPGLKVNERLAKLAGDFVAVARGHRGIKVEAEGSKGSMPLFKGHHAGMTPEELEVPVLFYSTR